MRVAVGRGLRIAGLTLCIVTWAQPAHAGGSVWQFDADHYQPGARAFAWATVSWEHSDALGTPDDGPYFAYISRSAPDMPSQFPAIPPGAVRVADVKIGLEPYDIGGVRFGPHHATIEFVVPDLPPGEYDVVHCNSPCTTTLGDITFGTLTIGSEALPRTTDTAVAPTTVVPSTTHAAATVDADPNDGAGTGWHALMIAGAATALTGAIAGVAMYARRRLF